MVFIDFVLVGLLCLVKDRRNVLKALHIFGLDARFILVRSFKIISVEAVIIGFDGNVYFLIFGDNLVRLVFFFVIFGYIFIIIDGLGLEGFILKSLDLDCDLVKFFGLV